jgi:hypothetical protein
MMGVIHSSEVNRQVNWTQNYRLRARMLYADVNAVHVLHGQVVGEVLSFALEMKCGV